METIILLWMSPEDFREHRIEGRGLALLAAASVLSGIGFGNHSWTGMAAFLPGILLLGVSILSREQLGIGDALLFLSMGFCLDPFRVMEICQASFLLTGIGGLAWLGWSRITEARRAAGRTEMTEPEKSQEKSLAMVPFAAVASGWYLWAQLAERGLSL